MERKKIIHIFSTSTILQSFFAEQLDYFRRENINWFLACTKDYILLNNAKKLNYTPLPVKILRKISPVTDLLSIIWLSKALTKNNINIAIAHTPKGGLIGMIAARLAGVPKRVYYRHGLLFETTKGFKRKLLIAVEKLTAACATEVICISPSVRDQSIRYHLNTPGKNWVIGPRGSFNGVNHSKFDPLKITDNIICAQKAQLSIASNDIIFGFAGRLVNDKGLNELAAAWKFFIRDGKKAKLLIAGAFEKRDALPKSTIAFLHQEPSIVLLGEIEDMVPIYALMDVFVLPSHREGLPTVILEASAMMLPVITTRATGCIDAIVENETGVFVSSSPRDIAEKMEYYYKNAALRYQHGKAGREFVIKNFNQQLIWDETRNRIFQMNT